MAIQIGAAVAAELANGARDMLRQGAAVITGNQGNYIANGEPESIYGKLQQATARQACRRYADNPSQFSGRAAVAVENACRPYLDDIGYGSPPTINKPFDGGQCPVGYVARYQVRSRVSTQFTCGAFGPWNDVTGVLPSNVLPQGPITAVVPVRQFGSFPGNTNATIAYQITAANGTFFINLGGSTSRFYFTTCGVSYEYRGLVWEPQGGGPDGCAPVRPDITDPVPPVGAPGPRIEPFNPSPDIDVDIDVEINPDLTIDVDFGTGPITIDPFGDGGDGGDGGGGGDPGDPTDPGSPGGGGSTGPGGEEEGQAPEGQELVGLLVTVTEAPGDANKFANNSKQPYRGIGYVRMGYPGRLGLDISGGTVISPQFFHAPQRGLTNWAVSANIGFNLTIVPYYRSIEP